MQTRSSVRMSSFVTIPPSLDEKLRLLQYHLMQGTANTYRALYRGEAQAPPWSPTRSMTRGASCLYILCAVDFLSTTMSRLHDRGMTIGSTSGVEILTRDCEAGDKFIQSRSADFQFDSHLGEISLISS